MAVLVRQAAFRTLPLLSLVAVYCLWIVAAKNGFLKRIHEVVQQEQPMFPESKLPLVLKYTEIAAMDQQLMTLAVFFWPVIQGANAPLNLFCLFGFGQFGGAWTLVFMEILRKRNKSKAAILIIVYGFFAQNASFAITTPLYLFIHLLTAPTILPYSSPDASKDRFVSNYDLAIIPVSVSLGYIIPSLLTIYPVSQIGSLTHQYTLAFWQAFPLWTVIVQWVLRLLFTLTLVQDNDTKTENISRDDASRTYLKHAGRVYTFVLALCVGTNLPAVLFSLLPNDVITELMPSLAHLVPTSFTSIFIPPLPIGQPVRDLAEGVHIFLLWDVYIGSVAGILWAIILYQDSFKGMEVVTSSVPVMVKTMMWTILGGPVAAWTFLMWKRERIMKMKVN